MAALAVIEVTALPLSLLHAACTLFLPTAGFLTGRGFWPRLIVGRDGGDTSGERKVRQQEDAKRRT
ncbi:hypothetical protein Pyn_26102 [Prunus yedoensis var. nudiflora]|uniref:Uncharacterized protein n=1 Tax=Prunus yedoensis var. nudiflora TaxID=2094558 RepID=A0A314XV91_PRUYE|nr:hypothetical protein Pyn_26102 [Prunus yedoensis var. nudiflora]